MNELHLFGGIGGGVLGGILCGHTCVGVVELDPYCRKVLLQRQRDGLLPRFPIWDDVRTFDGKPWRGRVDIVAGGFPCQDISAAGKGAGIDGERSGLWSEMSRIIGEVRPRFAFVENSPILTSRGLGRVLGDLAEMGYDARWGVVSAADAIFLGGDPCLYHERERIWIVATSSNANRLRKSQSERIECEQRRRTCDVCETISYAGSGEGEQRYWPDVQWRRSEQSKQAWMVGGNPSTDSNITRPQERQGEPGDDGTQFPATVGGHWWEFEPGMGRVVTGLANRVDRLRAIGNGQVSCVAKLAWNILGVQ